jgi:glyoxylase-like metal-dependent hydrolase (beta-lactamase superfamily II)/ferredoxin
MQSLKTGLGTHAAFSRKRLSVKASAQTETPIMQGRKMATDDRSARPENVEGSFYVDHTCIDCDTCRMMAPETFSRMGPQSAVHAQPTDEAGRIRALQALLSCPTFSIHVKERSAQELKAAQDGLPLPVPGTSNVCSNGWRSVKSFAGESYIIVRPEGNVMVDCPRFNPVLAKKIKEMGGIKWIFLTHKDDVSDHAQWAKHFQAQRILHADEVVPDTQSVEVKLTGQGPWQLPDGSSDITLIFTPGHTAAHVCLYYAPDRALFTGDHLSAGYHPDETLMIFTDFNWFSVPKQLESVKKLLDYDWLHVLPGHGRPVHLKDALHRLQAVTHLLAGHGISVEA